MAELARLYPTARFVLAVDGNAESSPEIAVELRRHPDRVLVLPSGTPNMWKRLCEFLCCVPPVSRYPSLAEQGQRTLASSGDASEGLSLRQGRRLKFDESPWIARIAVPWSGVPSRENHVESSDRGEYATIISADFEALDDSFWELRDDTFPGNRALFSPSNFSVQGDGSAEIELRREDMGVREYSSGSLSTRRSFLFGRFEAELKPPRVPGSVTGIFLHRDSPRQEIDIELVGKTPSRLLTNVYYNPGAEGARFDYGYRGTPWIIDLGFDASADFHLYSVEWEPSQLRWYVDGQLIHRRGNWAPTPIPRLPMKFHVNLWPSGSRELAGRLDERKLPAAVSIRAVRLTATDTVGDPGS